MSVRELALRRWSAQRYDRKRLLDMETVKTLLDTARRAPSSYNDQPWHLILGLNFDETHRKILETLIPYNRNWAKDAPLLAIMIASTRYRHSGKPNSARQFDCGTFWGFLNLQAAELGLMCRGMGGFKPDVARELFNIPEDYEPLMAFACGYPLEEFNQKPRKELKEFVFAGEFGKPFPFE